MIRAANIVEELAAAEIRSALRGKRCWHAYVGVGCTFAMDLGRKMPRDPEEIAVLERVAARARGKGPVHEARDLRYVGESHLLAWCSWRIEQAGRPLASADSSREECEAAVRQLIGKAIRQVDILPGWDLRLALSSDLTVNVFPDHVGPEANFDGNWELWRPEQAYLIGTDLTCQVIDRQNRPLQLQPQAGRWRLAAK